MLKRAVEKYGNGKAEKDLTPLGSADAQKIKRKADS